MKIKKCNVCGSNMVIRQGKFGKFYGCSSYPKCKNIEKINPDKSDKIIRPDHIDNAGFNPSTYQQNYFDLVKEDTTNIFINAVAGSGKTTTAIQTIPYIPDKYKKVLFCAFNKHIETAMTKKLPESINARTFHSLGFEIIRNSIFGRVKVDNRKIHKILQDYYIYEDYGFFYGTVKQIISLLKNYAVKPDQENIDSLVSSYGINLNGNYNQIVNMVQTVLNISDQDKNTIDFDDMVYMPIKFNMVCSNKYDFIIIDESQDLNNSRILLVEKLLNNPGRLIAVGDINQAIYGFSGANSNAVNDIIDRFNCRLLPLPITYRCAKSIVRLINDLFPEIDFQAYKNSSEGKVNLEHKYDSMINNANNEDMILCRTNAPLVKPCFELIRQGKKANIVGRDIGVGLLNLISKMNVNNLNDLNIELSDHLDRESEKLFNAKKFAQLQTLEDKIETIYTLIDESDDYQDLLNKIENIFKDDVTGIMLSSIHKAKGLESDTVYIIKPELMPHPMATKHGIEWMIDQEYNIKYVAYTRAKLNLNIVIDYPDNKLNY